MKFKYCFILMVILIILLSITAAAAGDDITNDTLQSSNVDDDASAADDLKESKVQYVENDVPDSEDEVDLSVDISFKGDAGGTRTVPKGHIFSLYITPRVSGGTAKNVKILVNMPNNLKYFSYSKTLGKFNPKTGIWDIGDLSDYHSAFLKLSIRPNAEGDYRIGVWALSDSVKSYSPKMHDEVTFTIISDPYVVTDSGERQGGLNTGHDRLASNPDNGFISKDGADSSDAKNDSSGNNSNPTVKSTKSGIRDISETLDRILKGIIAQDYIRIPLIIFALFLVTLVAVVGWDKFKS